ncbi:MAG: dUTP diphosphatase [Bacillales bacterium]|nr:dUTP diphosphatase [Bacillales bacterium]
MNLSKLYDMQKALDQYIEQENHVANENLLHHKLLALLVELGELANETRCFKFWSKKGPSEKKIILEEYVDGIHFLLSIGLELGFDSFTQIKEPSSSSSDLTDQFLAVYEAFHRLKKEKTLPSYEKAWEEYVLLANMLGFSTEDIERAYMEKNEVNYKRQREGY